MNLRSFTSLLPFLGAALMVSAFTGCGDKAAAPVAGGRALTKIVLQTDWYAQPEHGGFYQALAKGYYREAGLDVTIEQGGPNSMPAQNMMRGTTQFSIGVSNEIALAVSRGIPLVIVGALMQHDPQALIFHKESGLHNFQDLNGRTVMCVPGSAWLAFAEKKYGIKVSVTPLDYGLSRFLANKDLVQQCFITNEPYYLRLQGTDPGVMLLSDTGFTPYRVWYTTRDFIKQNPAAVRAFTAASIRGWREYTEGDRAAADALILSLNKQINPAFITYCIAAMKQYQLVAGDPAKGETVGQINPARLGEALKQLTDLGLLGQPLQVADIFDDSFLPAEARVPASPK